MNDKWTIRRVSGDARAIIEEVHGLTGISYGRLVSEAIRVWFDLLDQRISDSGNPAPHPVNDSKLSLRGDL